MEANNLRCLQEEALSKFLTVKFTLHPTEGGINNFTSYVDTDDDQHYVLRVYNNGNNSAAVFFEHAVLHELHQLSSLSFQVPKALPSLTTGETHVLLSNGAEAALFHLIPGHLAEVALINELGRACGELSSALSTIQLSLLTKLSATDSDATIHDNKLANNQSNQRQQYDRLAQYSPNPPIYQLYHAHKALYDNKPLFLQTIQTSAIFDGHRSAINYLLAELERIELLCTELLTTAVDLPKQLIHGDLHYNNILISQDDTNATVTGILDFEFVAYDWRGMELAINLNKYAGEKAKSDSKEDPRLGYFQEFIDGFMEQGHLTAAEMRVIPDLMILRIVSNVVYFVGRYLAKEDGIESLLCRADSYVERIEWIKEHRQTIVAMLLRYDHSNSDSDIAVK